MEPKNQFNIWYVVIAILGVLLLRDLWVQSQAVQPIPYSRFERYLDEGKLAKVIVGDQYVKGVFREPQPDGSTGFVTTRVEPGLAERLAQSGVEFTGAVESTFLRDVLSWVVPMLVFFGLWMFVFRKMAVLTRRGPAIVVLTICAGLTVYGFSQYPKIQIGDTTVIHSPSRF